MRESSFLGQDEQTPIFDRFYGCLKKRAHVLKWIFFDLSVFSSGLDRLYGIEVSTKASIIDPVDFIDKSISSHQDHHQQKAIFIGRNNTEIWAHAGSNVVFDCLVGRPNLEDHGPVRKLISAYIF